MKTKYRIVTLALVASTAIASSALLSDRVNLNLGGKQLSLDSVVVKGKTYVSLDQLKAQMVTAGGANQLSATEGVMNEWLFNGVWRMRVLSVEWKEDDQYWDVTMEFKNGTNKTRHISDSGISAVSPNQAFRLATQAGETLAIGDGRAAELQDSLGYKNLAAGMGTKVVLHFKEGKENDKPAKLIFEITPVAGVGYVKDPSFRVDLTKSK